MCGIAVNLDIEDVAAAGQVVIGCLDLGFVLGTAVIVDRHMVGVGVVDFVGHARYLSKLCAVTLGEFAAQPFGRCGQHAVVVLVLLAVLEHTVTHAGDDAQTQSLGLVALAVVLAGQGYEAFGKANEADAQRTLIDDALNGVGGLELIGPVPQLGHQQRELLGHGGLLEVEAIIELACGDVEHTVQLLEECIDAFLLVLDAHALDGQFDDIDSGERQVAAANRGLHAIAILKHASAAAHGGNLVQVALGVVGMPGIVLVIGRVKVDKIGEESPSGHLASQLVQVVVGIIGQVTHTTFLLPNLDGENGGRAIAHALIGREQQFADDAAALGAGVGAIVDAAEHHLIAATAVDGVHVVDECFHSLVHTLGGAIDGMLQGALAALEPV